MELPSAHTRVMGTASTASTSTDSGSCRGSDLDLRARAGGQVADGEFHYTRAGGGPGTDSADADCEIVRRVENPAAALAVWPAPPEGIGEH